jgi:hypothetical protein
MEIRFGDFPSCTFQISIQLLVFSRNRQFTLLVQAKQLTRLPRKPCAQTAMSDEKHDTASAPRSEDMPQPSPAIGSSSSVPDGDGGHGLVLKRKKSIPGWRLGIMFAWQVYMFRPAAW